MSAHMQDVTDKGQRRKDFSSSLRVQTGSGFHPGSCQMGTGGPFPGAKARLGRDPDHPPHLKSRSWMSRSYTASPHKLLRGLDCFTFNRIRYTNLNNSLWSNKLRYHNTVCYRAFVNISKYWATLNLVLVNTGWCAAVVHQNGVLYWREEGEECCRLKTAIQRWFRTSYGKEAPTWKYIHKWR
jgi:hypothetical protein